LAKNLCSEKNPQFAEEFQEFGFIEKTGIIFITFLLKKAGFNKEKRGNY